MLIESSVSLLKKPQVVNKSLRKKKNFLDYLPMKIKFRQSGIYMSILLPIAVGIITGFLSSLMGVGGGFIMVPAMIYLFRMGTTLAIGTSLFQIVFVTLNVSILQATYNLSVDLILAVFLLIGGVIGAQYGSKYTSRFKGEQIRILLALIVLVVCIKMGMGLINEPAVNSRVIIQDAFNIKIFTILIIVTFVEKVSSDTLIFDVPKDKIILIEKSTKADFNVYGFSDSKKTLVLKVMGPSQKVILQKKKRSLECGPGIKPENLVTRDFFTIILIIKITRLILILKKIWLIISD